MNYEDAIREALVAELQRQAEAGGVKVQEDGSALRIEGAVDLDALAMAIAGALAGGP